MEARLRKEDSVFLEGMQMEMGGWSFFSQKKKTPRVLKIEEHNIIKTSLTQY